MDTNTYFLGWIMENDTQFLKDLGERIRELRKAHGLTQGELAKRLGVTQALIASYESARRAIPLRKLCALAEALGISLEEIIGDGAPRRRKPGPPSKIEQKLVEIEKLPRGEQQFILRMLDNALIQAH